MFEINFSQKMFMFPQVNTQLSLSPNNFLVMGAHLTSCLIVKKLEYQKITHPIIHSTHSLHSCWSLSLAAQVPFISFQAVGQVQFGPDIISVHYSAIDGESWSPNF